VPLPPIVIATAIAVRKGISNWLYIGVIFLSHPKFVAKVQNNYQLPIKNYQLTVYKKKKARYYYRTFPLTNQNFKL